MSRIVRKYGGASLREPEQIRHVASQLAELSRQGHELVVVVSAMAKTTDELLELARGLHPDPPRREMDMLLSVGERISTALLALAIEAQGIAAVSYTGSQVGIITDTRHGQARIVDVRPQRLLDALADRKVVVVAGFQGVSTAKEITTLGRGGSDATAVALAAAIGAQRCELMKEVDGILTADPAAVSDAQVIEKLDYESALRLARGGTKALQSEAARLARDHRVPLGIGNSTSNHLGTIVTDGPLDCGEVIGLARHDNLLRKQGEGALPEALGEHRSFEHDGNWVSFYTAEDGQRGELSGITVVTSGRGIEGLQKTVDETLNEAGIVVHARLETLAELWYCVEQSSADNTVRLLHKTFAENGWLRSTEVDK